MALRLAWRPLPVLLTLVPLLLLPSALLWGAAALQSLGGGHPLDDLVALLPPSPPPAVARMVFLGLLGGLPALAVVASLGALIGGEVIVRDWTIAIRIRLPRPPWSVAQVVALAFLLASALLVIAIATHAIAD